MKFTGNAPRGAGRYFAGSAVAALALAISGPAFAQDAAITQEDEPVTEAEETAQTEDGEAIIVSGTRIRANEQYDFANPVVAIDAEAIQNSGVTNLTDFLAESPALVGSYDSNDGSGQNAGIGGIGLNLLNLRNLGTQRTLLLIDGRRHVAAIPGSSSVDVNTIPIDLIQRVDIVTGGTSAVYGADAVSGVVNFVTKRDFEGFTARAQAGISEEGDAGSQYVSVTAGKNFADSRANIALNFEYGHDDRFSLDRRSEFGPSFPGFVANPAEADGDDPNVPDYILATDLRYYDSNPASGVDVDGDFIPDFFGSEATPFRNNEILAGIGGGFFGLGGDGTPISTYGGEILPKTDRYIANILTSYDLTDNVRVFAQGKYARVDSESYGQPTFDFYIGVPTDNPYLNPAYLENNVWVDALGVVLITGRDNLDLGRRGERNRRETYRGVIGLEADLTDNLDFEISYVYGQSNVRSAQRNTRYNDRFFAALDAVDEGEFLTGTPNGNIVCRSNLTGTLEDLDYSGGTFSPGDFDELSFTPGANSGCLPINLFSNGQNQAAVNWINTDAIDRSKLKQHVVSGSISGNFGDTRLWGGPIGFAVGAEYRKEKSASFPDPVNTTGLTFGNALFPEVGSFDVKEAFAELRIPIVEDRPLFDELTINGAARVSDYSTVGTTWTYQGGVIYAPVRDIRFRGTYARAVRAPNIGELFGPQNQDFRFITDPCGPANIDQGSEFREANCLQLLQNAGLTPQQIADFTGITGTNISGLSGGNRDLNEETATTITAGVIIQPRFIPRLILSADYYDIKIEDAISTPTPTTIAGLCVDAPTIDNQFCDLIDRAPGSSFDDAGTINGFRRQPLNVAFFKTRGVDFSIRYSVPTESIGTFSGSLVGSYLKNLITTSVPGAAAVENVNTQEVPRWQTNLDLNWTFENFNLNYGINYFNKTSRFGRNTLAGDPDIVDKRYLKYDARFEHDIQLRWTTDDDMSFYVGVNNLFDQRPDTGEQFYPVSAVGRFFYAGVRISSDKLF